MNLEQLIREALPDATRAVDRAIRDGVACTWAARHRAIGERAADLCVERCPRIEGRISREQLIEFAIGEIGE